MAEMIPDRLPARASAGETKVFKLLQQLPDDVIVYYEPVVADRYPDFIVIIPRLGLLVIEVKGWYPNHILGANNVEVIINAQGQREVCKHPVRQARDYQFQLMDIARRHPETAALLRDRGAHTGKFIFPFGHIVVLNNCTRQQLNERGLSEVFPATKVLARDEFDVLLKRKPIDRLRSLFDPWWTFDQLSERQVSILRSVIHPEIVITPPAPVPSDTQALLKLLDLRQERNARSIGDGHRIVYGVAGSGKTVMLIARARLVAQDPKKRALILCYNRALADYFRRLFLRTANVTCLNFHLWGSQRNTVNFNPKEDEEKFGQRLLERLKDGAGEAHRYDAVFIDEAQDFAKSWFMCAKLALKEPDDGDLLIVADGSQSLYRRGRFTWQEAGVHAAGRTINRRFDLDKNYRNTREIMKVAAEFVSRNGDEDHPDGLQTIRPNPDTARRSGPAPEMLTARNPEEEMLIAARKIVVWLEGGLKPSEIAVLYRANTGRWVSDLVSFISTKTRVHWWDNAGFQDPFGVSVRTIHSAKGLQWPAVLVVRSDTMPFIPESDMDAVEQERLERGLMYVAMTRAEERLAFTRSTSNGFASQIQQLLDRRG
ncbi:MAG: ATP-binding domain-containing protein [Bradyrhizobiaceae bacterium]|nr:ATP-binding domain-containing protein [Bradyrhizobiaceae bacterium]